MIEAVITFVLAFLLGVGAQWMRRHRQTRQMIDDRNKRAADEAKRTRENVEVQDDSRLIDALHDPDA